MPGLADVPGPECCDDRLVCRVNHDSPKLVTRGIETCIQFAVLQLDLDRLPDHSALAGNDRANAEVALVRETEYLAVRDHVVVDAVGRRRADFYLLRFLVKVDVVTASRLRSCFRCAFGFAYAVIFAELFLRNFAPVAVFPRYVTAAPFGIRVNEPNRHYWHTSPDVSLEIRTNSRGVRSDEEISYEAAQGSSESLYSAIHLQWGTKRRWKRCSRPTW